MKTKNITVSLPIELVEALNALVEKGSTSQFVTKALVQAIQVENQRLKQAYFESNTDPDRQKAIKDWSILDTEGWD